MEAAAGRAVTWARELGLTPAARARMARVRVVQREADPAERLLTFPRLLAAQTVRRRLRLYGC